MLRRGRPTVCESVKTKDTFRPEGETSDVNSSLTHNVAAKGWWPIQRRKRGEETYAYERQNTIEELRVAAREVEMSGEAVISKHLSSLTPDLNETEESSHSSEFSLDTVCNFGLDDNEGEIKELIPVVTEAKVEKKGKEFDISAYMSDREMTPTQEKLNALTVVPNPLYCLYFLLAGKWLSQEAIEMAREVVEENGGGEHWQDVQANGGEFGRSFFTDENGCIQSPLLPHMHGLPPLPVVAVAIGIILHAPFSFLYHWHYACVLPPGLPRIEHWSRRLDHSFIHVISACMAYGTSGSWDYFLASLVYNVDCIYRQFKKKVRPRSNKIRIIISVTAYTIPILRRGDTGLFLKLWIVLGLSGYLFAKYPIGGWSHSAFHFVIAFAPHLLMTAACNLLASQGRIHIAARCAILGEK